MRAESFQWPRRLAQPDFQSMASESWLVCSEVDTTNLAPALRREPKPVTASAAFQALRI